VSEVPDYESAYRDLRVRVTELLRDAGSDELERFAPATPQWRVRDIAAHLGGVCDDIAHGNMDGVGSNPWTDAQVAKRADWPIEQLLDDWAEHSTAIESSLHALHPAIGQMLADAVTHEHDIRGALASPGARDSEALVIGVDWSLPIISARLVREGSGTLRIEHEVGVEELGEGEPVTRLRADRFELARAMTGRRSRAQMEAMDWDGPLDRSALVLALDVFTPPAADLIE